jgi:hypothetical protein
VFISAISGSTVFCLIAICPLFHSNELHIPTLHAENRSPSMCLRGPYSLAHVCSRAAGNPAAAGSGE